MVRFLSYINTYKNTIYPLYNIGIDYNSKREQLIYTSKGLKSEEKGMTSEI